MRCPKLFDHDNVRKGTNADAIGLFASAGQDVLYLTGRFGDYTQTKSSGGVYTFTRNFTDAADASLTEVVNFSMNSSGDRLVFADGGVTLRLADYLTGGSYANITDGQLNRAITTPGLSAPTPALSLASDTGRSASDGLTNNATINVTGLVTGGTWQYQVDAGGWQTGTGSSFIASTGAHNYLVRQSDLDGLTSGASTAVVYTIDTTAPVAPSLQLAVDTGQPGVSATTSDGITNNPTVNVGGLESGASYQYQLTINSMTLSASDQAAVTRWLAAEGFLGWKNGSGNTLTIPDIQERMDSYPDSGPNILDLAVFYTRYHPTGFPLSLSAQQTDAAGNVGAESSAVVLRYDKVAPSGRDGITNLFDDSTPIKTIVGESTGLWQWKTLNNPGDGSIPDPGLTGWNEAFVGNGSFDLEDASLTSSYNASPNHSLLFYFREIDLAGNISGYQGLGWGG